MRGIILVILAFSSFIYFSCSEDDSPTESGGGTNLSGTVLVKATQQPVSGAKVSLGDQLETTTDASGNYKLSDVPTIKQVFRVEKDDYAVFIKDVTPVKGENTENVELETHVEFCNRVTSVTYQGRTYNTVLIDKQCWFRENLNAGTRIDMEVEASNNGTLEKYCYSDLVSNCDAYGGLYKWDEAMNYISAHSYQGICPDGWHIPTDVEFQVLMDWVSLDGNALKDTAEGSWGSGYSCCIATNTTGFSSRAGGRLMNFSAGEEYFFADRYVHSFHWGSTESNNTDAFNLMMWDGSANPFIWDDSKGWALSVRCLKD